jgi:transposase
MTTFLDLDTGRSAWSRDATARGPVVAGGQNPPARRERVQPVAIDPSAAFRKAITTHLPVAALSADAFDLV